jgi:hypothetical protein
MVAIGVLAASIVFDAPTSALPPAVTVVIGVVNVLTFIFLLLRSEFLPVIAAIYTVLVLAKLPISSDLSAPATGGAIVLLVCVAMVAMLSFRFTLSGRPLFRSEM